MAIKSSKRQDLEVHLGSSGQVVGRLYSGNGKRSGRGALLQIGGGASFSDLDGGSSSGRSLACRGQSAGHAGHRFSGLRACVCIGSSVCSNYARQAHSSRPGEHSPAL